MVLKELKSRPKAKWGHSDALAMAKRLSKQFKSSESIS
jgi:hypothetical protein